MANQDQLDLLKQGTEIWNTWRKQHPALRPDLRGVDLRGASLWGVNLTRADLSGADLSRATLSTIVALSWRTTTLKPVREQNWFERSARRGVGLKRGGHLFQASDGHMRGLAQPVGVGLPVDASIGHPTGSPLGA
jgi:Pentapeptide repeats (8 copies)